MRRRKEAVAKASFEKICQEMGLQPSDCLMVGDRDDTDGKGARSVGMAFTLVKNAERPMLNLTPITLS